MPPVGYETGEKDVGLFQSGFCWPSDSSSHWASLLSFSEDTVDMAHLSAHPCPAVFVVVFAASPRDAFMF